LDALTAEPLETLRQAGPECLFQPMLELISVRGSKSAQGNWTDMYLPGLDPPKKKLYLTHPNRPIFSAKTQFCFFNLQCICPRKQIFL